MEDKSLPIIRVSSVAESKNVEVDVTKLSDEELRFLWESLDLEEARLEMKERSGIDPANPLDFSDEATEWYLEWCKRNPERYEEAKKKRLERESSQESL